METKIASSLCFSLLALALLAAALPGRTEADQPTCDLDYGSLLYGPPTGDDQQTTVAVNSVGGNDANAGTLLSPKLMLPISLASNDQLGLYRGSVFRASLPLAAAATLSGSISVRGLSLVAGALPVVSALDPVNNSGLVNNGDGTYSDQYTAEPNVANDGYQNVYVVEVNTTTEAAMPVASRHRLIDVTSSAACVSTPGSAFVFPFGVSGSGGWLAQFHPSDSLAPGSGSYRYEVVSRYAPADWGAPNNLGDGAMSGLELVGSSWGYGSLGGPTGFVGDRLAILHCSTHNAVLGGGSLQRSVFYEEGAQSGNSGPSIMLAWYAANPAGTLSWNTNRCLFYANVGNRQANCLISHSGDGTNYGRGDISDCAFLGARWSDNSLHGTAIDYENVATGTINRVYVQAIDEIFGFNMPLSCEVEHSVFRQVRVARVGGSFHDNLVLAESASDPANLGNRAPGACLLQQNGASVTNNILWAHGLVSSLTNDDQAGGIALYPGVTTGTVQRNIIVLNPANTTVSSAYVGLPTGAPTGLSIDYNLVVNLTRGGFVTYGGTGNTSSWAAYQAAYPTLDAHSMYVDLSADPRGIQALFMDPINGDFRWAQTEVARRCAAFCRANNVGPATVTTHWPIVPSVDDAVAAISLLPPKITSPGAVTFTASASGEYQITTNLDGTPDAPSSYCAAGQPAWLSVMASSGFMSGTPTQTGNTSFSVSATNRAGTGTAVLGITVQTAFMAWQNTYFTAAELNNPAISGPNATPAGDAIPNLLKYALGLDPKINGTNDLPTIALTAAGGSRFLTLMYNQSLTASDVTFTVEVSSDLQAWSSGSNNTTTVSTSISAAGTVQTVVQRDLTPTSSARQRFIRLKIKQL